jgi:hypothetical protein
MVELEELLKERKGQASKQAQKQKKGPEHR